MFQFVLDLVKARIPVGGPGQLGMFGPGAPGPHGPLMPTVIQVAPHVRHTEHGAVTVAGHERHVDKRPDEPRPAAAHAAGKPADGRYHGPAPDVYLTPAREDGAVQVIHRGAVIGHFPNADAAADYVRRKGASFAGAAVGPVRQFNPETGEYKKLPEPRTMTSEEARAAIDKALAPKSTAEQLHQFVREHYQTDARWNQISEHAARSMKYAGKFSDGAYHFPDGSSLSIAEVDRASKEDRRKSPAYADGMAAPFATPNPHPVATERWHAWQEGASARQEHVRAGGSGPEAMRSHYADMAAAGQTARWQSPGTGRVMGKPAPDRDEVVTIVGPYLAAPPGWPPHMLVRLADGTEVAVPRSQLSSAPAPMAPKVVETAPSNVVQFPGLSTAAPTIPPPSARAIPSRTPLADEAAGIRRDPESYVPHTLEPGATRHNLTGNPDGPESFGGRSSGVHYADVTPGKGIRLHGVRTNHRDGPQHYDKTYNVGDLAEHDSYNLSYSGPIKKITAKSVEIENSHHPGRVKRFSHASFAARNHNWSAAAARKRNSEWSD